MQDFFPNLSDHWSTLLLVDLDLIRASILPGLTRGGRALSSALSLSLRSNSAINMISGANLVIAAHVAA